jgi:O-antigen/teichoic acid export membrane protein
MSVSARLISGTVASWVQIGITLITQVLLVPLYLTYWNVETYGLWLAVIAFTGILNSLDLGYQEYLGYEFLRIGKTNTVLIGKYLSAGVLMGFALGLLQILIVLAIYALGLIVALFGESTVLFDHATAEQVCLVLLMQGLAWLIFGSVGGILNRALYVFGHFPRMAWWGVLSSIAVNLAPALAVWMGADLMHTGIVMALARIGSNIPVWIDMILLFNREGVKPGYPSWILGWKNFVQSLYLCVAGLLENMRHQGARMLLTPLAGAAGLAAFSTMRTGTNVAMQGLHTITHPLMPELMGFLHRRDQVRSDVAFGTIWVVTVIVLGPAMVLIQLFIAPVYLTWTKNQIPFNPWLFATLSIGILVYAISQPAIAVVRGNNLLKSQVTISAVAGSITIAGIIILVPLLGISGGGFALLAAEIAAYIYYTAVARKWLKEHTLRWPAQISSVTATSVCIASVAITLLILLPTLKLLITIVSMAALLTNSVRFWRYLPELATERVKNFITGLPLMKQLFSR